MGDRSERIGYGTADGATAIVGMPKGPQLQLLVATATHWRPMDPEALEEFERD